MLKKLKERFLIIWLSYGHFTNRNSDLIESYTNKNVDENLPTQSNLALPGNVISTLSKFTNTTNTIISIIVKTITPCNRFGPITYQA